jgi:polynucleotide 5'-kinase involved in rRNA processing
VGAALQATAIYGEAGCDEGWIFVRGPFNRGALFQVRNALQVSEVQVVDVDGLSGTVVGLHDERCALLALGILRTFDPGKSLRVLAPLETVCAVRLVAFGSFRVEPGGKELGIAPWR